METSHSTSPSFSLCYPRAVLGIILSVVLALACNYPGPGGVGIKSAEARALEDVKEVDNEEQIELSGRQLLNSPGYKGGGSKGGWKGGSKGGWKNKGNYNHKYKYKKNYDDDDWHDDDWCQYNYCGGYKKNYKKKKWHGGYGGKGHKSKGWGKGSGKSGWGG